MTPIRLLAEAEEELRAAALAAGAKRGEVRVRTIARFPYRIYYRARPDEIVVVAIGHHRRKPGFWRSRG